MDSQFLDNAKAGICGAIDQYNTCMSLKTDIEEVKEKCKYYKILNNGYTDFVSYSCADSSYKGKIGFMVAEGFGYISHFPPE